MTVLKTNGGKKNPPTEFWVDDCDVRLLSGYSLRLLVSRGCRYVVCSKYEDGVRHQVLLHNLILGAAEDGVVTDHIDGNGLNNARSNLRRVSYSVNNRNKPRLGFSFDRRRNMFRARMRVDGREFWLGYHKSASDARAAYCAAISKLPHFGGAA